jgi:hypothetical protein
MAAYDPSNTKVTPIFAWNDYLLFFYNRLDDAAIQFKKSYQMRNVPPEILYNFISLLSEYALNLQFDFFPWLEQSRGEGEKVVRSNLQDYAEHFDDEKDKKIILSISPQDYVKIVYNPINSSIMIKNLDDTFRKLIFMHAIMKHWELGKGSKNNRKTFVDPRNALRYNSSTVKYGGILNGLPKP